MYVTDIPKLSISNFHFQSLEGTGEQKNSLGGESGLLQLPLSYKNSHQNSYQIKPLATKHTFGKLTAGMPLEENSDDSTF